MAIPVRDDATQKVINQVLQHLKDTGNSERLGDILWFFTRDRQFYDRYVALLTSVRHSEDLFTRTVQHLVREIDQLITETENNIAVMTDISQHLLQPDESENAGQRISCEPILRNKHRLENMAILLLVRNSCKNFDYI